MGAKGLKLYGGHALFHDLPLDHSDMDPLYRFCQSERIPILYHVNPALYGKEFENVLRRYDTLKVICPHLCLSTINTPRLEHLMDDYPQLFTDLSMGYIDFLKAALLRFSRSPARYRKLLTKYSDRILFGTDMVVTDAGYKTAEWLEKTTRAYRDLIEKGEYEYVGIPGVKLRGLSLPPDVRARIYRKNFESFMSETQD
jgi:uncharacterized protein